MSESYLEIQLDKQPIELCKLLKIADLVAGGGEAKVVISEGYVLLNGEVEYQKRKKVYHDDIVEFNGERIQVVINEELSEDDVFDYVPNEIITTAEDLNENTQSVSTKSSKNEVKAAVPTVDGTARLSKRKPISF
ncbi:RNA-binding S4 domain-containing protein [Colwellia sp. 4_MG-2023]|jgi:ribosome-associated protein|uniref:RNA-binding S4 domain-containing protein n=1 Tax=unclassified Colwellia TaxID=196834 RepID=UPI001C093713|nr:MULTISPECIES: RNA-binding S4 domain-containing protein [unclassified Colwellia]MBU2924313.1 RNA-binding S4 domain-containing protein [Colwellia sp. C2M11]MDO6487171.1 RNA-binding S4 domain-containing protein [Colwellia sp. 6_MG-2023]MDO6505464.1 RNA-binding S4 domain-containing protein [Colwellia sp. 5_MG-2023]MDO6554240.1 RNA-binding S4 domain-containing protein [Colwellia sp. 4_MG-2023]MDO6650885.1 RNA-binding S4 domain-containing protein [Colwellia sp. 3_MG-2023]